MILKGSKQTYFRTLCWQCVGGYLWWANANVFEAKAWICSNISVCLRSTVCDPLKCLGGTDAIISSHPPTWWFEVLIEKDRLMIHPFFLQPAPVHLRCDQTGNVFILLKCNVRSRSATLTVSLVYRFTFPFRAGAAATIGSRINPSRGVINSEPPDKMSSPLFVPSVTWC